MVGGQAGLAGIHPLAPHQPPRGGYHLGVVEHDRRTLAPQFEGHRREVAGRGRHHQPAHPGGAGEEDVVEPLLQQARAHGRIARHHLDHLGREVALHQCGDHIGGARGMLRWLEHGGVAGRQGAHQGPQAELEGVVPRPHDQHAAEGLQVHRPLPRQQPQGEGHRPGPGPAGQMAAGMAQFVPNAHRFEPGLHRRFAHVVGQGLGQHRFGIAQQGLQVLELGPPPGQGPGVALLHQSAHRRHRYRQQGGAGGGTGGSGRRGHGLSPFVAQAGKARLDSPFSWTG